MKRLLIVSLITLSFNAVASEPTQAQITNYENKRLKMTYDEFQARDFELRKKYFDVCSPILNFSRLERETRIVDNLIEEERTRILRTSTDWDAALIQATNMFKDKYLAVDKLKKQMKAKLAKCYQDKIIKEF